MTIDPQDAAAALDSVSRTAERTRRAEGYARASAPLIIWGVAWMVANALCEAFPSRLGLVWLVVDAVAIAATFFAVSRQSGRGGVGETWRYMGAIAAVAVFVIAVVLILPPGSGQQVSAFISLMTALMLAMAGIWRHGPRFTILGLALGAAITAGYLMLAEYLYLWLGFVGGGALVLAGLWMRRA